MKLPLEAEMRALAGPPEDCYSSRVEFRVKQILAHEDLIVVKISLTMFLS
jgi:hypothetical protein